MKAVWIYRHYKLKFIKFREIYITYPVRRKLPTGWNDLTDKQFTEFINCMMICEQSFDKEFDLHFRFMVLNSWLRIPPNDFYKFSDMQVAALLDIIEPIFETAPDFTNINLLDGCMPKTLLISETTEAFAVYETFYQKVLSGEKGALLTFASYLFRESGTAVDDALAKESSEAIEEQPIIQFALYWWYYRTRAQLVIKYPGAFGKGGSGRKGPNFTAGHGWWGLMYSVAQDGPFADFDELKNAEVHSFLDYLEFNHNRAREIEWHERQYS